MQLVNNTFEFEYCEHDVLQDVDNESSECTYDPIEASVEVVDIEDEEPDYVDLTLQDEDVADEISTYTCIQCMYAYIHAYIHTYIHT